MSDENLRFVPPDLHEVGDTLRIFIKKGPDGRAIIDTLLENRGKRRNVTVRVVYDALCDLTQEARRLAAGTGSEKAIDNLAKAIELLAAFIVAQE